MGNSAQTVDALTGIGIDPIELVEYADPMFQSDEEGKKFDLRVPLEDLVKMLMKLRGGASTVKDFVELRKFLGRQESRIVGLLRKISDELRTQGTDRVLQYQGRRSRKY